MLTEAQFMETLGRCCGRDVEPDTELVRSGILDSLALVLLAETLEEQGRPVSVARIPKAALTTPRALWDWLCRQ